MSAAPHPSAAIAIIDDDEAVRSALSFALRAEGYAVRTFGRAEDLLQDPGLGDIACFVVDLRLPGGDGLSTIESLRRRGVTAPAILVTTQPDVRRRQAAQALGVPIVEKPLMGEALSNEIRRLAGSRRGQ